MGAHGEQSCWLSQAPWDRVAAGQPPTLSTEPRVLALEVARPQASDGPNGKRVEKECDMGSDRRQFLVLVGIMLVQSHQVGWFSLVRSSV